MLGLKWRVFGEYRCLDRIVQSLLLAVSQSYLLSRDQGWVLLAAILCGVSIVTTLLVLWLCFIPRRKSRRGKEFQIPLFSKEISIDEVSANKVISHKGVIITLNEKYGDKDSENSIHPMNGDNRSMSGSFNNLEKQKAATQMGENGKKGCVSISDYQSSLTWDGAMFTLRDLEICTDRFSRENIIGEGGYGILYRGHLVNLVDWLAL
ncbi:hypothetical protein SAY87_028154 [Trapa incisa]|uniref:non-specific serine/threonine protein kinase n=1 Tax=Trapa incisa TaxID=236973 RepID=A0AAN7QRS5_9MYRT|nr:hypothetical protein SAY87_028154 [Trapa incisa]